MKSMSNCKNNNYNIVLFHIYFIKHLIHACNQILIRNNIELLHISLLYKTQKCKLQMLNANLSLKKMQIVGTGKANFIAKETSFDFFSQRSEIEIHSCSE